MHCSIHRHDKINQTFKLCYQEANILFWCEDNQIFCEDNYILKSGCPQDNHFLKRFLRPC